MSRDGTVLLTGGTAQVGLHLLPLLQHAGFQTVALSRSIKPVENPMPMQANENRWLHPGQFHTMMAADREGLMAAVEHPRWLISAGPIGLAIELLDCCSSIRRMVCLSTTSVFTKAESSNQAEREQIAGILQAESRLKEVCTARGIDLVILRPTLIYGCGMDQNISRVARFIKRFGFVPLAGPATGLRQPIHVADLAALMLRASQSELRGQHEFVVAGGSTLAYREMVARIFRALGKTPRMISLPAGLLVKAVSLAGRARSLEGMNSAMVQRQNQDLVFDDSATRQCFDFQPRPFEPGPEDFKLSAEVGAYLPAG
ncbi:MAG TPA: NAD-dependent epimerase/dehydratase family protein [Xanthomonadales bacterium]|nr:NAD-dependent epimerase/dehydratase family protein [Xanthomonadales bacterium]